MSFSDLSKRERALKASGNICQPRDILTFSSRMNRTMLLWLKHFNASPRVTLNDSSCSCPRAQQNPPSPQSSFPSGTGACSHNTTSCDVQPLSHLPKSSQDGLEAPPRPRNTPESRAPASTLNTSQSLPLQTPSEERRQRLALVRALSDYEATCLSLMTRLRLLNKSPLTPSERQWLSGTERSIEAVWFRLERRSLLQPAGTPRTSWEKYWGVRKPTHGKSSASPWSATPMMTPLDEK